MSLKIDVEAVMTFLLFLFFYFMGYMFAFGHGMLRRIEKTHHPSVSPLGRKKGLSYGPLFVINGLVFIFLSFIPLHLFLVNISQNRCGIFISIPITLAIMAFGVAGTVSLFNPEKMLRLYVYANKLIRKYIMKSPPPPPIPEEVYKRQILNIRITGAAWIVVALAWSCILY